MTQSPTIPPFVNNTMKFLLRSPLHGMVSKSILLITFTGRKSGKTYTTPVSYSQTGDQLTIFTHGSWWKNLRDIDIAGPSSAKDGAPVTLRLRGRDVPGLAQPVVEDKAAIAAALVDHLRQVPQDARYYGVTLDASGAPNPDQVRIAAEAAVMVRVRLC